jgi:hypothetical protein
LNCFDGSKAQIVKFAYHNAWAVSLFWFSEHSFNGLEATCHLNVSVVYLLAVPVYHSLPSVSSLHRWILLFVPSRTSLEEIIDILWLVVISHHAEVLHCTMKRHLKLACTFDFVDVLTAFGNTPLT